MNSESREENNMLKFGAVTIDVSHPKTFSKVLGDLGRGQYTAVFNDGFRGEDEVIGFSEPLGLKVCGSLEELADEVDIGMIHSCNWDKHIDYAMPFIVLMLWRLLNYAIISAIEIALLYLLGKNTAVAKQLRSFSKNSSLF